MMYKEFVERTHNEVSDEEYRYIEMSYYDFDGSKDDFCNQWLKDVKTGKWEMELKFRKVLDRQREEYEKKIKETEEELDFYRDYIAELREENDRMKELTNRQLQQHAALALENEYGFAPKLEDVVLLEADGDGNYILFEIKGKVYSLNGNYIDKKNEADYRYNAE